MEGHKVNHAVVINHAGVIGEGFLEEATDFHESVIYWSW